MQINHYYLVLLVIVAIMYHSQACLFDIFLGTGKSLELDGVLVRQTPVTVTMKHTWQNGGTSACCDCLNAS